MKKNYYIFNPGVLERKDNTIKFSPIQIEEDGSEMLLTPKYIPIETIGDFYCFGILKANSALFNYLGQNDVSIHFFDYYNNYTGSFVSRDALLSGRMIIAQTQFFLDKKKRLEIAKEFIGGAAFNMKKNINYYNTRGIDLSGILQQISLYESHISTSDSVEALMGVEGNIRQCYYEAFNAIIKDFSLGQRTKQPPQNEVNALISFGNMLCYTECLRAIKQTQLNPTISYLHTPGERRYSLSLDISEIFKPILVDRVIFRVLNKREIQPKHFDQDLNRCLLNQNGCKIFVRAFEERLEETFKHRSLKRKISYRHLIKLECYKLSKHLLGIEKYKPFKMYW